MSDIQIRESDEKGYMIIDIPLGMILKEHPEFEDKKDILPDPYPILIPNDVIFGILNKVTPNVLRDLIINAQKAKLK